MTSTKSTSATTVKDTPIPLISEVLSDKNGEGKEWTDKDMKEVLRKMIDQYNWECFRSELEFE